MTTHSTPLYRRLTLKESFSTWANVMGILALAVSAGIGFFDYNLNDFRLWLSLVLTIAYCFLTWGIDVADIPWLKHAQIGLLTLIPVTLILVGVNGFAAVLMFFILSASAMYALPERAGYIWICLFALIIMLAYYFVWTGQWNLLSNISTFAGMLFVGSAASSQVKALEADQESRRLLAELQKAHEQLQEQAMQAEELTITNERNRLAREVHDTLGHRLTVAAVQLEGAQKLIHSEPTKAEEMVGTVHEQVLQGLNELRKTVSTLRAPIEEELSLPSALPRLANNFENATGIKTELTIAAELPQLPSAHRHTLYRSAQELLTNIQKHAHANQAWVTLQTTEQQIVLTIEDDGCGFDDAVDNGSFGLHGLRERVAQSGGEATIRKRNAGGTKVTVSLPQAEQIAQAS